jgi:hypothetical protein
VVRGGAFLPSRHVLAASRSQGILETLDMQSSCQQQFNNPLWVEWSNLYF